MRKPRIMFCGPSGIGKTTLCKYIEEKYDIPFISGSYYDLINPNQTHKEILSECPKDTYERDFQLLTLRRNLFKGRESFVTDRSFVDNAAYFWYKQDTHQPECELEHFLEICRELMEEYCDILIMVPLFPDNFQEWKMEDNGKRITNRYYQIHMTSLMFLSLNYVYRDTMEYNPNVIVLGNYDLETRKEIIDTTIESWMKK